MKKTYYKPPLSFNAQLELLKERGLKIENEVSAIKYLQQISYYRLSAYFLPYQSTKDVFDPDVTFGRIIETYAFDRELRLLIFDCIERIEIAVRTQIIYHMALHHHNAHWQDDQALFQINPRNPKGVIIDPYTELQEIIQRAKQTSKPEVFIKHYLETYEKPSNPPSWMCLELLTIGQLSSLYRGLRHNEDKKRIAGFFKLHHHVFSSWLHSLTYVRNICAHHSRLWNRDLAIEPLILQKPTGPWVSKAYENNKRIFYFICVLKYLLDSANPGNRLKIKLELLFEKYKSVPIRFVGLPSDGKGNTLNWKEEALFNN